MQPSLIFIATVKRSFPSHMMIGKGRKSCLCRILLLIVICGFLQISGSASYETAEAPSEPAERRVLHSSKHSSSSSSASESRTSTSSSRTYHVHSKYSASHSSSHLKADSSIGSNSNHDSKNSKQTKIVKDSAPRKEKEHGKDNENAKVKEKSKHIYEENVRDVQMIEKNNVQIGVSFLAAIDQMFMKSGPFRSNSNLRQNVHESKGKKMIYDSKNVDKNHVLASVLHQSELVHAKLQESKSQKQDVIAVANATLVTGNTTVNNSTQNASVPLPPAPDNTHLTGFARKKDWFGSAICNQTTMRDRTIDNVTAAANEFYDVVDMLNICWISSLRNPSSTESGAYVYTKAIAKRKQYPMVPFKYLSIQRTLYSDNQCTPGNEMDEELFQDQLIDLNRKYNQEYPEKCRKSHMPMDDPLHANTVHSRIGDVVDDHDPLEDSIEENKEIVLKAYSSPEDCLSQSGHAIISATLPNCVVGPNHTSSMFLCNQEGYEIFRYDGLDCDDGDMLRRESYTRESFCENVLPVDAVLGFTSIRCHVVPSNTAAPAAETSSGMKTSTMSANISENIGIYIRQPVDFKGFWSSRSGGLTAGGVGILGMILFIASAFSFFRLKEGPYSAGVSDI